MRSLNAGCGSSTWGSHRVDVDPEAPAATKIMDIQDLQFPDLFFEETRCISVLEHVKDWRKAVSEICRVTGGRLVIEVPVNSDLRKTEFFRILFPTLNNLRLLADLPNRARNVYWQFKPDILAKELERKGFKVQWSKVLQIYVGALSRCYRFIALRRPDL